jgi:resuscitation-promoting factor RpfB
MIKWLKHNKNWRFLAVLLTILLGAVLIRIGITREITVVVDGEARQARTAALTVSGALRAAEVDLRAEDHVVPERGTLLWDQRVISITRAQPVLIKTPEEEYTLLTPERAPSNLMRMVGIDLFPQDQLRVNGEVVDPQMPLNTSGGLVLQYEPAVELTLLVEGEETTHFTHQPTVGAALEQAGVHLGSQDWISEPLMEAVTPGMTVSVRRAAPITVNLDGLKISGMSAGTTVGEALQDAGVPLQNLDASLPPEDAPIPENREISVLRVWEDVMITTDEVAYENDYVEDPNTVLDQISVIEPGQVGIFAARERVRYEGGEEVARLAQDSWQASEAQDGVLGYGTKVEIRTEVVDGVTIEYWRKKSVYATSYEPCDNQGNCWDGTAGGYPLQMGIVAVTPQWYSVPNGLAMADLPVYVPGYGRAIIGDVGGGIPGTPWIDLAYRPEDDFTWDAHWTTMYFLTPVPDNYPAIIVP